MTDRLRAIRREPPRFRRVEVRRVEPVTPRLVRVTLGGDDLEGFRVGEPAASVRLLLPEPGERLAIPTWNGNEFLRDDGTRPTIRTFTPRRHDPGARELDIDIVVHGDGAASTWVEVASQGDPAAISGPGRGYTIDADVRSYLLAGDETAVPAISQLLEWLGPDVSVQVIVEVGAPEARHDLPDHPGATVRWVEESGAPGDALVAAIQRAEIGAATRVWVAGEASAMFRVRRHLFDERDLSRREATVRGYWKRGRGGDDGD